MGFGPDDVESLCRELNVRGTPQRHCLTLLPAIQRRVICSSQHLHNRGVLQGHQSSA